jgi:hypothetical protein
MINWKTILIGSVLAVILNLFFSLVVPLGGFVGLLAATIYVGYKVGGEYRNGVNHGAIVGVISAIIIEIVNLILMGSIQLEVFIGGEVDAFITTLLLGIIVMGIIGAIGGFIGAFKGSKSSNESTT